MAKDPDALERRGRRGFWRLLASAGLIGIAMIIGRNMPPWIRIGGPLLMVAMAFYVRWAMKLVAAKVRAEQSQSI